MRQAGTRPIFRVVAGVLLFSSIFLSSFLSLTWAGGLKELGALGGTDSVAYAINDEGRIVGSSYTSTGATRAFLYSGRKMTDLGTLGGEGSEAYGINGTGLIVGTSFISPVTPDIHHAFLYSEGKMTDLGTLGGDNSTANSINISGQIVGGSQVAPDPAVPGATPLSHAFMYAGGLMTDLGTLGGENSFATAINDAGQVVGWSDTASGESHAFLYSGGKMTDLGTLPGGSDSLANSINSKGQAVGWSILPTGETHAVLFFEGTLTDLGTLGGENSEATAINDAGQVVGWSDTASGESHAFLYSGGKMTDLGTLKRGFVSDATAINNSGQAVGWSLNSFGSYRAVLYLPGSISARPSSLNFGLVGKDGSLKKEVVIKNSGPGILHLNSIALTGTDEEHFTTTHDCDPLLVSGGTCTITVTFQPSSYGSKSAVLAVSSNDPRKPSFTMNLRGNCPYPKMTISPSFLDFGNVPQKETSNKKVVFIKNSSPSDLSVASIELNDKLSFALNGTCSTVNQSTPCPVELTFSPQDSGSITGVLTISSDDPKSPAGVKLRGRGK